MAIFSERYKGWDWPDEEREKRKERLRQVDRTVSKIQQQVPRIENHAPEFAESANEALRFLIDGLGDLMYLDLTNRAAKYKPCSPDEADRLFDAFPDLLKPWKQLVSSRDYIAAVRASNKDIRRVNNQIRKHNRKVQAAEAALFDKVDVLVRRIHQGDFEGALDQAAKEGLL